MPGCSAGYCTNSSVKGFQMCRLPRAVKRRKIWLENMNRPDWIPGENCTLCEVNTKYFYNLYLYFKKSMQSLIYKSFYVIFLYNIYSGTFY